MKVKELLKHYNGYWKVVDNNDIELLNCFDTDYGTHTDKYIKRIYNKRVTIYHAMDYCIEAWVK